MIAVTSLIKRYSVPLILFAIGLFFQLIVLPASYPLSHYDVLGVKRFATLEEIEEAYHKFSLKWSSNSGLLTTSEFIKVRYAFELLTNPIWKRDYDLFALDEHLSVLNDITKQYSGENYSKINLPLLDATSSGGKDLAFNVLTPEEFGSVLGGSKPLLIQVYSNGSYRCASFINNWKRIAGLLDGVADTGMVELGNIKLTTFFAERYSLKHPIFRNGLPSLVAFPPTCVSPDCYIRYTGDLSVDSIVDWLATNVLGLPRILYYSKESLVQKFFANSGVHKVKVIFFSETGERAFPFLRLAAKDYSSYASFAAVLWKEEDSSFWWNMFQVDSAPAIVFVKDPGVNPVVHHGRLNSSFFIELMETNKHHELPQLRSVTSMELGCDAKGSSRAGHAAQTWYCTIIAGRPGPKLNKMRESLRRVKSMLLSNLDASGEKISVKAPAAFAAFTEKRLTFTWLDGGAQKAYCLFYLHNLENIYETCGPNEYDSENVPRLLIVRYKVISEHVESRAKGKLINNWGAFDREESNLASQIVAIYNGSVDIQEVIQWISWIVEDGDKNATHPFFIGAAPSLIPEDSTTFISKSAQNIFYTSKGIKDHVYDIILGIFDFMRDPRVGPFFFLAACISLGTIWLKQGSQPSESIKTDKSTVAPNDRRRKGRKGTGLDIPASITDTEPADAYQMLSTDSGSD